MTPEQYGAYLRPEKSEVVSNTFVRCGVGISIGDRRPEYPLAPRDITIAKNLLVASRVEEVTKPERFTWKDNVVSETEPAGAHGSSRALTAVDVGPGAK
jgi:hypothetical protein